MLGYQGIRSTPRFGSPTYQKANLRRPSNLMSQQPLRSLPSAESSLRRIRRILKGRDPEDFKKATCLQGLVRQFRKYLDTAEFEAGIRGSFDRELVELRENAHAIRQRIVDLLENLVHGGAAELGRRSTIGAQPRRAIDAEPRLSKRQVRRATKTRKGFESEFTRLLRAYERYHPEITTINVNHSGKRIGIEIQESVKVPT